MRLRLKGYCVGVLLIHTITTISLPAVGRCEPTLSSQPYSPLTLHNVRNSDLTTNRPNRERQHLDPWTEEEEEAPEHVENTDGSQTRSSAVRSEHSRLRATMVPSSSDTNPDTLMQREKEMYSSALPSNEDCSEGKVRYIIKGTFYIIGQLEADIPNMGYQSDSAVSVQAGRGQQRIRGQQVRGSEESWKRLQPVVECGDDAMTLVVRRRRAVQLLLAQANESSLALTQLPPQCGYSVQTTWRDLSLMAHYNACHVTQEGDSYVLPLLWRGTPVKMSCPVSQTQPLVTDLPFLCCSLYGMIFTVRGEATTEELRINVRGEWTPLVALAEQCGYILDSQGAEIVTTAPYLTCGITVKNGKYTLPLQIREKTFTLSCPVSPPEEVLTHQPLISDPYHLSRGSAKPKPEILKPSPWAPPFYLAPLYYPHPTYHRKYPRPDVHSVHNPSTPSPTPDPAFSPQPLSPVDSQPDYLDYYSQQIPVRESYKQFSAHSSLPSTDESTQDYPDLQQNGGAPMLGVPEKHSAAHSPCSATGSPVQAEAPSLQPPSYAFNPYYHYYHHPKIPLPGPPQDPDPGPDVPEELSSTNYNTHKFPLLPPNIQQSNSNYDLDPVPDTALHPHTITASPKSVHRAPAPHIPYPQLYPYYHHYDNSLSSLHNSMATNTNLSHVQPLSGSAELPDQGKYNMNPHTDQPNTDAVITIEKYNVQQIKNPFYSQSDDDDGDGDDHVKSELGDKNRLFTPASPHLARHYSHEPHPVAAPSLEQPSLPSPSNHNPLPHPYNYYSYHDYYRMYYTPESLHSADNHAIQPSSKESSNPLLQSSSFALQQQPYHKHQATGSPTEFMYDVQNGHLHPYYHYYYHLLYQPKVSEDHQEPHPAGSMHSDKTSSKSQPNPSTGSDHSWMDLLIHSPEVGYPSIPWMHSLYSHFMSQQHPYDPFEHPGEEDTEQRLQNEMRDHLKANTYTPSASPCSFGPALNDCCYPVKDCTMGQHFVFAVPDSVVEPTVPSSAHPSENSNVSCTLQRLISDPDIYIVPLHGCGVNKHVFGETVVHLLEVQGFHSLHQDHDSVQEYSPIRLMVECSSSPGSLGEVRLHVMDQPPPPIQPTPATVTVQLRIATDKSFTSYHPEAHLPLSLLRGSPLYLEVRLQDPPELDLVLLVHSCLAYTQAPYTSWIPIYSRTEGLNQNLHQMTITVMGFPRHSDSQLLPSPHSTPYHIRRIIISHFLSLPSQSSSDMSEGGQSLLQDPEIYFLCLTEVCFAADADCTVIWSNSPNSNM